MSSLAELGNQIALIQKDKLSGVIMVTGSAEAGAASQTASLRFESGQLSRANSGGQLNGKAAVMAVCALVEIAQFRWMQLNASANWAGSAEMGAAELAGLFGLAQHSLAISSQELAQQAAAQARQKSLVARVHQVFANFYLGDYEADLRAIEAQCPVQVDQAAFISLCVAHLAPFIGEKDAAKLLKL